MGEVYRARDERLHRDVAIKVVPAAVAGNPEAMARFERESRAIAALSHPNILAIFDVGQSDGHPYAVIELLEGETLHARLEHGPLPVRKAVDIATQIARGLAAAHDKQIAHRDLKPENVFLTPIGGVKILDFGLARRTASEDDTLTRVESATRAPSTTPGTVLGTVGYMSPEQVRGETADHRSDIFALGCVLYEMLTGQRAYKRDTAAETMSAILREDPPDPATMNVTVPPGVMRALRRCLEKRPQERFESARDLAFALESSVDSSSASGGAALAPVRDRRWLVGAAAALVVGAVGGYAVARFAGMSATPAANPQLQFHRLTFDKGSIRDGRFTPDGQSIIYDAAWNGEPLKVFMARVDGPESAPLNLPTAHLLSVSKSAELAVSLGHTYEGWMGEGTLARSSVLGSAPRVMVEHVREADWAPDGADLAIVRRVGGLEQLEFPVGTVLYQTSGYISDVRFSPAGDRIAFADHQIYSDDAGSVAVVDKQGHRSALSEGWLSIHGLAWTKDGSEVWFGASKGSAVSGGGIYGVTPQGQLRTVLVGPMRYKILDIASDGRVLISHDREDKLVEALMAGASMPVEVNLHAQASAISVAEDGSATLLGDLSSASYETYLLKAGGTPVHLGTGQPSSLSPDGKWALSAPVEGYPLFVHPTGPGSSRQLPDPDKILFKSGVWLDNTRIVGFGQKAGDRSQGFVQDVNAGPPRRFTPEGAAVTSPWWALPVSPDGTRVVAVDERAGTMIYAVNGDAAEPVKNLKRDDVVVQWAADGRALLVAHGNGLPWIVERLDLASGQRTPAVTIRAHDPAGLRLSVIGISRNGKYWVHTYSRMLSDLYVVEGLK